MEYSRRYPVYSVQSLLSICSALETKHGGGRLYGCRSRSSSAPGNPETVGNSDKRRFLLLIFTHVLSHKWGKSMHD